MKIKICGITRLEDALFCAEMHTDFIGFVFVGSTPRYIDPERAAAIRNAVRGPRYVGVFRDASVDYMAEIANVVGLDLVQLHGSEPDEDVLAVGMPVIRALKIAGSLPNTTTSADWLLFDTYDERRSGGPGRRFDWALLAGYDRVKPFFLAGGLNPDNIEEAIRVVRPDAIDVSSGVEFEPGIKDHVKVRELFERARRA